MTRELTGLFPRRAAIAPAIALVIAVAIALAIALCTPMTSAAAEGDTLAFIPTEFSPDSALAIALAQIEGTPISLAEVIELALEHRTELRDAEAALRAAEGEVRREKGAFDPELFGEFAARNEDIPPSSPFVAPDSGSSVLHTDERFVAAGARMLLPIGTQLQASLATTKRETNQAFASVVPEYNTTARLDVTQPLLKGFGPSTRRELSAAERRLDAARARHDDAVLEATTTAEETYWDLYAAERNLAVQQLIRDRAEILLRTAQTRVAAGLGGPNEAANARVFLAEQEQLLLDREERLDQVSDQVVTLTGIRPTGEFVRFRPVDDPPDQFPVESEDSLVALALRTSLEVESAEREAEAARADAKGARWDALPALDVFGSLGANGLSGTGRDVSFGGITIENDLDGDFSDTWDQVTSRDFPTWSAGVRLSFPIGLREGRGEHQRLLAEASRAEEAVTAARQSIEERVRGAYRELIHATRRVEVSRMGVDASLEQVRIGALEYRAGRTSAFELVQLGSDLGQAQQRYSTALVRAAKAAAQLKRWTAGGYPGATRSEE